jgi:hypothetical protein
MNLQHNSQGKWPWKKNGILHKHKGAQDGGEVATGQGLGEGKGCRCVQWVTK